jgi:hypothetical protein
MKTSPICMPCSCKMYTLYRSKSIGTDVCGKHVYIFLSRQERGNEREFHSETPVDTLTV